MANFLLFSFYFKINLIQIWWELVHHHTSFGLLQSRENVNCSRFEFDENVSVALLCCTDGVLFWLISFKLVVLIGIVQLPCEL